MHLCQLPNVGDQGGDNRRCSAGLCICKQGKTGQRCEDGGQPIGGTSTDWRNGPTGKS